MSADPKIEAYLGDVRAHLGSANAGEEEEVIHEIAACIQDLVARPGATIESVLEQMRPAARVAHRFRDANLITKASKSNSPPLLLRASLRNGIPGVLAFLVGLAGYWLGGCVLVFGTLAFIWSGLHYTANAQAAIGTSMIQTLLTAVIGAAVVVLTTFLLRALLRVSKRARPQL